MAWGHLEGLGWLTIGLNGPSLFEAQKPLPLDTIAAGPTQAWTGIFTQGAAPPAKKIKGGGVAGAGYFHLELGGPEEKHTNGVRDTQTLSP